MSQRPAWQMTRAELLSEARRLGLAPHPNWTAVELRSAITEVTAETKTASLPKGLSSMRLQELKDEAMKVGLPVPEKATRGTLMRNIRDYHATPGNTLMTIGKHKGNTYEQVPRSYGLWADAEEKANGANMHPDLRRYVMWFRRQANPDLPEQVTTLDKMNNPEKYAVVSFPEGSMKSDTDLSWDEVRSMPTGNKKGYGQEQLPLRPQPSSSSSSSRPTKRPVAKDKGTARMGIEPDPKVLDEIRGLHGEVLCQEPVLDDPFDVVRQQYHVLIIRLKFVDHVTDWLLVFWMSGYSRVLLCGLVVVERRVTTEILDSVLVLEVFCSNCVLLGGLVVVERKVTKGILDSVLVLGVYCFNRILLSGLVVVERKVTKGVLDSVLVLWGSCFRRVLLGRGVDPRCRESYGSSPSSSLENVFGESGEYLPKRGAMPRRTTFGEEDKGARRISLGYYSHGGLRGICNKSAEYASFSIYMKHYILHYHPEARWTSMAVSLNNEAKIHGDYHNLRGTLNYLTCAGGFSSGGGLWREIGKGEHVPEDQEIVERYTDGGEILRGMVLPAKGVVAKFPGEYRHATEPWEGGNRWSITCFTTRSFVESTKNEKRRLRQCGYPVPDLRHLTPDRKFIQMQSDVKQGPPCRRVLPRYSTRKSMWKAAVRASVFLTWSLASLSSAQAMMTTSYEKGVTILEIGGFQQSLAVTETINADIAEPISWTELKDNNGKQRVLGIISDFIPNVVWINPPEDSAVHNSDDHDRGIHDVCTAVDWCAPEQLARKGSLVVEMTYLSEQDSGKIRAKLDEYGEVTEHLFEDTKFLKARPREDHQAHVTEDEGGGEPHQPPKLGASGITFDETVKPDVAATLRRLHQNLGHPSVSDLVRHLRLAGGSSEILKAAKSLRCETCLRCRGPRSPKPSSEPRLLEFGDVVGVDMMFAYDIEKKKHKLLSIVDFASSYHLVIKVPNQTGETLEKAFLKHWIQILGAPKTITLDLETGIQDAFSRLSDWYQIDLQTSAGQAHWQAGFCERHGKWWKEIFMRVVEDASVTGDDVETAIAATSMAKNNLRRRCGWAPTHIVFGRSPRDEDDIHDKEIDDGYLVPQTADDAQRRRESIRSSAKAAFLRVRAEDKIRRGTLQRARVRPRDLPNGEMALFWRKDKNNKKGAWRGPGVVIGRQHENYWIARGGRCFLCAPEHVRQASPEELGGLFALRATQEDLQRLIERDHDDEDIFEEGDVDQADIEMPTEIADENELQAIIDDLSMDEGVEDESLELPNGELRPSERRRRRAAEGGQDGDPEPRPVRRRLRRKGPEEALMMKRAMTKRGKEKQIEKELPWRLIPLDKQELFKAAEAKQWQEHLQLGALMPLSVQESEEVRKNEPDRIIGSRFAYRDKNYSKRRSSPDIEWKPKARLVVAGHCDPEIMTGALRTDSPTVSRTAVMSILQITASRLGQDWTVAAGDVTAAFLNGDAMERRLFLQQPKHGLPGLHPSQLIAIQKGVFGLVDSPRKWWRRFRQDIQCREIKLENQKVAKFVNSPLDPCVFQLMELDSAGNVKEDTYPLCYAAVHVDDILLAGPRSLNRLVQEQLSHCFPVEEWETDSFDFIGSHIEVFRDEIRISQGAYVSSRLFEVEVDTKEDGLAMASAEQLADNRSLIGALSWLDVRFTNSLARQALQHGDEAVVLKNLDLSKLLVTVYHDAGWGNAPPPGDDPYFRLYTSDEERVEWKSHACDRVCRSTFGAETMGCIEGIELGQYVKALMSSLLTGQLHRKSGEEFPLVALTDCRSLYDHFHKDGLPRTPTDRRLAIDIACLRQAFKEELKGNEDDKAPLVWVPTDLQRADLLTKPRKPGDWWRVTTSLTIPVREKMIFEQCKSEVVCELSGHRKSDVVCKHSRLASMYSI
ncbi:Copia protein [Symbiodinium microadriaticum]|uniref:Copia protein n=1 Tax=Symbiodinium microadriaticum TaxID=2951 RepID=A0A1Q9EDG2_SYMMI|nr:Copia protein [Symbiodinium microadriaticum]